MKLREVRIQNFRSFDDETIRFDDYTCFVGPNGGGKSNVLTARPPRMCATKPCQD